ECDDPVINRLPIRWKCQIRKIVGQRFSGIDRGSQGHGPHTQGFLRSAPSENLEFSNMLSADIGIDFEYDPGRNTEQWISRPDRHFFDRYRFGRERIYQLNGAYDGAAFAHDQAVAQFDGKIK